jgi:hypothetical protein
MPEPKRAKKTAQPKPKTIDTQSFDAQADSFLGNLQIVSNGTDETAPKLPGQPQGKPTVVKLINFIKKM